MLDDHYWEPPQTATRNNMLEDFNRKTDNRIIRTGKRINHQIFGQAEASIFIERLVNKIIHTQHLPYAINYSSNAFKPLHETPMGEELRQAISLLGLFDSYHDYSEHMTSFLYSCWMMSSVHGIDLVPIGRKDFEVDIYYAEAMNDIVMMIRKHSTEEWFQRAEYDRRLEADYKTNTITTYTADVLRYYASTTVVRVDFSYLKEIRRRVTVDDFYHHLDQLLSLKDRHAYFQHLVGYAWHLEQGERKGFHIHCTFMFNGSEMSGDVSMGFMLANLWEQITLGAGSTYVCNANKASYDQGKLGIGYIRREDAQACINAINANSYLTKDTQYLRMKPKRRRTFGYSKAPDITTKRGRPVIQPPTWVYSDAFQRHGT